jgi:tRNA(Ile)-lysidine synthase TilS/MesJ
MHNLDVLGISAHIVESNIFEVANSQEKNPCYLCARMRRGVLYKAAKELGCNKIALGHHFDDVIETTLMNMLNSGSFQTMVPKLHSLNFEGMELIRPMYLIREHDIIKWANHNELKFIQCACKFTEELHSNVDEMSSKRYETKMLIQELKKHNELVEQNIFMAAHNVNIDMVVGYKKGGIEYEFRTTLVKGFHNLTDIKNICKMIKNANKYYLQKFIDSGECLSDGLEAIDKETALEFLEITKKHLKNVSLRGY